MTESKYNHATQRSSCFVARSVFFVLLILGMWGCRERIILSVEPDSSTIDGARLVDSTPPTDEEDVGTVDLAEPEDLATFECTEVEAMALYKRRIEPLFSGGRVTTCNQCHLSGMDLTMYARETPCKSMACMVESKFVDLRDPDSSKVLEQILQAEPGSALITEAVIQAEHDGFKEWIEYSAHCHHKVCGVVENPCDEVAGRPTTVPAGVMTPVGQCDEDELIEQFEEKVMEWQGRCHGCHSKCDPRYGAPCWLVEANKKDEPRTHRQASIVSLFNLLGLKAINLEEPMKSPFLLKPMPEDLGGLPHEGGVKINDIADPAYQDFREWLIWFSHCYKGAKVLTPTVTIKRPYVFEIIKAGSKVMLQGSAVDANGLPMTDEELVWTSSHSEEIVATGKGAFFIEFPPGRHIITLTATDAEGNQNFRASKVKVKAP